MIYLHRIDLFEGIDVNKTRASNDSATCYVLGY